MVTAAGVRVVRAFRSAATWRRRLLFAPLALAVATGGCRWLSPFESHAGTPRREGGRDGPSALDGARDGPSARLDGADARDLGGDGATDSDSRCPFPADKHTVALYTFDDANTPLVEARGRTPTGLQRGTGTKFDGNNARSGCGRAAVIPGNEPTGLRAKGFIEIPDHAAWDLTVGSVQFLLRFRTGMTRTRGVLSRDAVSTGGPGNLAVILDRNNILAARLQGIGANQYACHTGALRADTWYRVKINFGSGGMTLAVDGKTSPQTTALDLGTARGKWACGTGQVTGGIAGNNEPWVLGADAQVTPIGSAPPADVQLGLDGMIDQLRISKVQR